MKLEVTILSEGEAALDPVLRESGHFAEPKDRGFNLTSALTAQEVLLQLHWTQELL